MNFKTIRELFLIWVDVLKAPEGSWIYKYDFYYQLNGRPEINE